MWEYFPSFFLCNPLCSCALLKYSCQTGSVLRGLWHRSTLWSSGVIPPPGVMKTAPCLLPQTRDDKIFIENMEDNNNDPKLSCVQWLNTMVSGMGDASEFAAAKISALCCQESKQDNLISVPGFIENLVSAFCLNNSAVSLFALNAFMHLCEFDRNHVALSNSANVFAQLAVVLSRSDSNMVELAIRALSYLCDNKTLHSEILGAEGLFNQLVGIALKDKPGSRDAIYCVDKLIAGGERIIFSL